MIKLMRKICQDRRGNVLVIMGAALPLVVGSAGLGSDTIQWALWKRQLQRAADSAALAGAYALADGKSYSTAADNDLAVNNHTGVALTGKSVTQPTVSGYTNAVRVELEIQQKLPFSSLFIAAAPAIGAEAVAAISKEGSYCVMALSNTTDPSITINGNVTLDTGCGIISNSTSTTAAISVSGNSHIVNAEPIAAVGAVPPINGVNTELPYQLKQSDPYAGKFSTDIPAGTTCRTLSQHITQANSTANGYTVVNPGCYHKSGGGNSSYAFRTSNQKIAMNPGTYYIKDEDFDIGANSDIIVNSADPTKGVTIILTGDTPGTVQIGSNAEVKLRAPSDGSTYNKMLFIQKAGASGLSTITGNAATAFDGIFYFPSGSVDYNGGGSSMFKCAMIVGWKVTFSGNSSVQNNTNGCNAATKQQVDRVRLVQ